MEAEGMKSEYYYVYCRGLLGVKTNMREFKWVYGSVAPEATPEEYEACLVKFHVIAEKEKKLGEPVSAEKRFQSYAWDPETRTLFYRRKLLSCLHIGYDLRVDGNTVEARIGKSYGKWIRQRIMHMHGAYYLLADVANMLLLKNGYLTLYASAVSSSDGQTGIACFAPANTGKTVTATKLCESSGYRLVGEDVVVTDGKRLFSCPWTSSYRKQSNASDSAGSFGRVRKAGTEEMCETCGLTDLAVLSSGKQGIYREKEEVLRQIRILNGYLFQYYSSPILKVLAYFDPTYDENWNERADQILKEMAGACACYGVQAEHPLEFYGMVHSNGSDGKI